MLIERKKLETRTLTSSWKWWAISTLVWKRTTESTRRLLKAQSLRQTNTSVSFTSHNLMIRWANENQRSDGQEQKIDGQIKSRLILSKNGKNPNTLSNRETTNNRKRIRELKESFKFRIEASVTLINQAYIYGRGFKFETSSHSISLDQWWRYAWHRLQNDRRPWKP